MYAAHDYALPGFIDGGPYPGVSRGVYVDRAEVEKAFLHRTEFMRDTGTPIWIGEFGPLYTGDPAQDSGRYQLLADQLAIYAEYGASWSIWAYKDIGGQGLVYAAPDSPWRQRIAGVVAKKARLGVDSWGGRDTGVRHIMTPIEETLSALTDLVHEGKVRYLGHSNFTGWQTADAEWTARTRGLERFVSAQNEYSWLERDIETDLVPALKSALGR